MVQQQNRSNSLKVWYSSKTDLTVSRYGTVANRSNSVKVWYSSKTDLTVSRYGTAANQI
jgi:hypothetical protein